jgi:hypothetical protein
MTNTERGKLRTILPMAIVALLSVSSATAEGAVTVFDTGLPDQLGSQQSDRDRL